MLWASLNHRLQTIHSAFLRHHGLLHLQQSFEDEQGQMRCMHGLIRCGSCCVDYGVFDETSEHSEDEDDDEHKMHVALAPPHSGRHSAACAHPQQAAAAPSGAAGVAAAAAAAPAPAAASSQQHASVVQEEEKVEGVCPVCHESIASQAPPVKVDHRGAGAGASSAQSVDRRPRILGCGHTCCHDCLQQIISQNGGKQKHQCPLCRLPFRCASAAALPFNYMLMQLLSQQQAAAVARVGPVVSPSPAPSRAGAGAVAVAGAPPGGLVVSSASSSSGPHAGTKLCSSCHLRKPRDTEFTAAQIKKQSKAKCKACVTQEAEAAAKPAAQAAASAAAPAAAPAGQPSAAPAAAPAVSAPVALHLRHLPVQRMPRPRDQSAERRAQDLVWDAWDLPVFSRDREQLVESALRICPDLPDALLSKTDRWIHKPGERDVARALPLIEHALASAADRLGSDFIGANTGHLWSAVSVWCRPYMRALFAYSRALWSVGRRDEAIAYSRECLRLNSGDNQGARYHLATWLLERNDLNAAQAIVEMFPNGASAAMAWNRALLSFMRGDREAATAAARAAERANRLVRGYLLGAVPVSEESPASIEVSGDSEAAEYARQSRHVWQQTPGAIEWLATI